MEYNAVQLGDAADPNLVISVGDWVYITPAKKGEWMEIGLITALWQQDDVAGKGYDAKWAYRSAHILKPETLPDDTHPREIFYTESEDGNMLGSLSNGSS